MRGKKNAESPEAVQDQAIEASQTSKADAKADAKTEKVKTLKMVRDDGKAADVHPDEVANYALGGYKKV